MKKIIVSSILLMLFTVSLIAGPAYPGRIPYTQPDGTVIGIHLHGDEFGHWVTDDAGRVLEQDADGFWRVSTGISSIALERMQVEAEVRRAAANQARREYAAQHVSANFGSPKIPVILVGFNGSGQGFSKSNEEFNNLLNQPGYSANNAIGSVLDYFTDNSLGQFTPVFEVLGPVTVDHPRSYYGTNVNGIQGNDQRPEMLLVHAAQKLDSSVDFSRYDNDGDGVVDFVMFYFAGYDEAQGGSSDCIWSHAWYLHANGSEAQNVGTRTFDKVALDRYFCTAELKGYSGSTMCSIGTTCHEFAHTLGLPDFYDANDSTNGNAANMYDFDLMASGSYNVDSTTPPYLNSEELTEIGWLSSIPELTETSSVTLPAINYPGATQYSAFMTRTSVSGEYFVYETRGGKGWDASLPTGLLVYHVDKSSSYASRWSGNSLNNYSDHPCCYVIPAKNPTSLDEQYRYVDNGVAALAPCMFGSSYKNYTPTAWNGNATGFKFREITYSDANGVVMFNVINDNLLGITGVVMNTDGDPISGATISVAVETEASSSPAKSARKDGLPGLFTRVRMFMHPSAKKTQAITRAATYTVTTGDSGEYSLDLPAGTYQVTASMEGYVSKSAIVTVTSMVETQNFYLMREGETLPEELTIFPAEPDWGNYGSTSYDEWPLLFANIYTASYLGPFVGKQIKTISFVAGGDAINHCHVVVDYGDTRKLALPIDEPVLDDWTTIDVREQELIIPSGKDLYVGYGGEIEGNYPIWATSTDDVELIGYMGDFDLSTVASLVDWDPWAGMVFAIKMTVGDYEAPDMGYNYIADPKGGSYAVGDVFELNLIETEGDRKPEGAIEWFFDDEPVSGSVTLPSGNHVVEARFTTTEGKRKVVELEINVN